MSKKSTKKQVRENLKQYKTTIIRPSDVELVIPEDTLALIVSFLSIPDLFHRFAPVCKYFYSLVYQRGILHFETWVFQNEIPQHVQHLQIGSIKMHVEDIKTHFSNKVLNDLISASLYGVTVDSNLNFVDMTEIPYSQIPNIRFLEIVGCLKSIHKLKYLKRLHVRCASEQHVDELLLVLQNCSLIESLSLYIDKYMCENVKQFNERFETLLNTIEKHQTLKSFKYKASCPLKKSTIYVIKQCLNRLKIPIHLTVEDASIGPTFVEIARDNHHVIEFAALIPFKKSSSAFKNIKKLVVDGLEDINFKYLTNLETLHVRTCSWLYSDNPTYTKALFNFLKNSKTLKSVTIDNCAITLLFKLFEILPQSRITEFVVRNESALATIFSIDNNMYANKVKETVEKSLTLTKFDVRVELQNVQDMKTLLDTFKDMERRDKLEVFIPWKLYLEHHKQYLAKILCNKSTKRKREESLDENKKFKKDKN